MKKKYFYGLGLFLFFTASGLAQAADSATKLEGSSTASQESAAPASKHWKASASTYYYNFEGTQAAHGGIYNFGKTTLSMQLAALSYETSPGGWTFLALGQHFDNYVETNMPIPGVGNVLFHDRTLGWGDVLIDASHPIFLGSSFLLFGDVGVSVPTGSIDKKNPNSPIGGNYAYNMQMGSGTYDAELGTVAVYLNSLFQAGTHISTYQRMGESQNGYRLGNLYKGEGWLDVPVAFGFTPRIVGYYKVKQAIHGMDPTLGRNIYTEYYHHDQQNWDVSAALKFEHALMGTATLVAEAGKPLTQGSKNSDQVVVSTNYYGTVGVSGTF
ncbi:MAG: hypothetical protein ACXVC0_15635 [Bdellovibrionota bacterium]